jgi:hypothetical protein
MLNIAIVAQPILRTERIQAMLGELVQPNQKHPAGKSSDWTHETYRWRSGLQEDEVWERHWRIHLS